MVVGLSRGNLWATQTKKLQRLAIELHIPLLFGYDVIHDTGRSSPSLWDWLAPVR